jgi:hypothetical protein
VEAAAADGGEPLPRGEFKGAHGQLRGPDEERTCPVFCSRREVLIKQVKIVAAIWIVLGGAATLGPVVYVIKTGVYAIVVDYTPQVQPWMERWHVPVLALQVAFGPLGLVAGLHLLGGRRWACLALEILSWLVLAGLTVFSVIWFRRLLQIGGRGDAFEASSLAIGAIAAIHIFGVLLFSIIVLRSRRSEPQVANDEAPS